MQNIVRIEIEESFVILYFIVIISQCCVSTKYIDLINSHVIYVTLVDYKLWPFANQK